MAISISTHSLPIEPKEGEAKNLFERIQQRAANSVDKDFKIQGQDEDSVIISWTRERKRYTSRMNKDLDILDDEDETAYITNTFLLQLFPKDDAILFSRDRTFKMRSVRNFMKELFEGDAPSVQGFEVSKDKMERLKGRAKKQGIRTTQVKLRENKHDGAIELDRLTYSDLIDEIHAEVMENEDVHKEFLKLSYSDIIRDSNATIKVLLYLNSDKKEGFMNYISFNVKIDYGDKEENPQLDEDKFWAKSVYHFVRNEKNLPKSQKTFDRFS